MMGERRTHVASDPGGDAVAPNWHVRILTSWGLVEDGGRPPIGPTAAYAHRGLGKGGTVDKWG